ncbi:MAG: hydantoinase B/oxoprolinase family protein [Candidatus Marinimicrobia bacterium]|jgi:N-methylhydantoinase B|nr:hydantoinase B/oxoprolinase family protein [Candidatus Neomarinimicrobiota bacterium]MDP6569033.1 hydantoinase B/oxoprolinase family protein [Candidatus Neomarinimicrobiota bacterium]MDP7025660.1 hydantoinase B/oxoprolinase family protein [Candidatus Neomarinimicrobiota bacterium]|tara:strand:- start:1890 stop:3575 length:1686 start_codon:yes stop_codon:yes gene_type:complete
MADIDKILLSIFQRTFKSITDEMSISLTKTTRSPILCEAKDFVTGLYDASGQMLEQTENLPILSFSLGPVCKVIVEQYGDNIYPGDVIIHNDVFSMGNQNNDVAIFKPIFHDNVLIGWAAAKGHQADIGGSVQGGYNPNATEVWQEALRIPAVKIYEKGKLRKDVWDLIFANIRLTMVQEDIKAQVGACTLGERRLKALVEKYGVECYKTHKKELFRSTEKMMKSEIAAIPNGVYRGDSMVFYDGKHKGTEFTVRTKITVDDDAITFDFSESSDQTKGFVNGTYTSTCSAITLTFLQMINPNIPHNEGMIKPLHYIVPEGILLNASYPAATTFGNHLCPQVADAIFKALSEAIPDRVTAGWNHLLCSLFTGINPRTDEKYVDIGFLGMKGGSGALYQSDGYDHIGMIDASGGVLDQDYEMFEQQTPHKLIRHEYLTDSAGAGKWRGGLGVITEIELGSDDTTMVIFGDGDVKPPYGLFGGKESVLNRIAITYPDGKQVVPMSKDMIEGIPAGTVYHQIASGGGGYGNPEEREREKVLRDVQDGVVSRKQAEEIYNIKLDED